MKTIQAKVNSRLLTKASRLFTGTLEGRITEILQNARRAGATEVEIANQDGYVTVRDNGSGIEDFAKLLDLGGSGWEESFEQSEDPAGVGLFCLAPRPVTIRSNGQLVTIAGDGWTGAAVTVSPDPDPVRGTLLCFEDEPWSDLRVEVNAVFCGMKVVVDGKTCPREVFVSAQASHHQRLGCRIEVREEDALDPWHRSCRPGRAYGDNVLVNFHGQIVAFHHYPLSEHHLQFLVDMTGEPTGIRLMLPARTRLVENEAFAELKSVLELEAYRYLQRRGHHRLMYKEYLRARELGISLPEATPTYRVGLLTGGDGTEPIELSKPDEFPLASCYRFDDGPEGEETDSANVHLLAALGAFEKPFIPVDISSGYDGYSWAKLPAIGKVEVQVGNTLQRSYIWSGELICVDSITITARTSDGRVFSSPVCMAVRSVPQEEGNRWSETEVLITPDAQGRLLASDVWYHLGGWSDEGDTYDTQEREFEEQLEEFWGRLVGPDENLRRRLREAVGDLTNWRQIILFPDGKLSLQLADGSERTVTPPVS